MKWVIFIISLISAFPLSGQVFLQIEKYNDPNTIKLSPGESFTFALKEYPDTWIKQRIEKILVDDDSILFRDNFYHLNDFDALQFTNQGVLITSSVFLGFGASWAVFGGIAALADGYVIQKSDFYIGGISLATGYLFRKFFVKQKFKLGRHGCLRIVDLRI